MPSHSNIIPFPKPRILSAGESPPAITRRARLKEEIAGIFREAVYESHRDLIEAFRDVPQGSRNALIGLASAWGKDPADRARALADLCDQLTPAERLYVAVATASAAPIRNTIKGDRKC